MGFLSSTQNTHYPRPRPANNILQDTIPNPSDSHSRVETPAPIPEPTYHSQYINGDPDQIFPFPLEPYPFTYSILTQQPQVSTIPNSILHLPPISTRRPLPGPINTRRVGVNTSTVHTLIPHRPLHQQSKIPRPVKRQLSFGSTLPIPASRQPLMISQSTQTIPQIPAPSMWSQATQTLPSCPLMASQSILNDPNY